MATKEIPLDIIYSEILPRLPIISLLRFKSVSKSFRALISSPEFITHHLHNSLDSDANGLLIFKRHNRSNIYSYNLDDKAGSSIIKFNLPLGDEFNIVGSCNGLLCLKSVNIGEDLKCMLLNPSTRSYKEIHFGVPELLSYCSCSSFGFGYDHRNDDYKIVGLLYYYHSSGEWTRDVMVYSLKSNSSRRIEKGLIFDFSFDDGILIDNHLLHWTFISSEYNHRIGCFNICTEQWQEDIPLPNLSGDDSPRFDPEYNDQYPGSPNPVYIDIGAIDGCLCLSMAIQREVLCLNIWVMKDYGMNGSWVKLFDVSHSNSINMFRFSPLASRRGSRWEILLRDYTLARSPSRSRKDPSRSKPRSLLSSFAWFNIRDNKITETISLQSFLLKEDGVSEDFEAHTCGASLVTIPNSGDNQIGAAK